MTPIAAFALLVAVDVAALVAAYWLQRPSIGGEGEVDVPWSVLLSAALIALTAHALATIHLVEMADQTQQRQVFFGSVFVGLAPALVFARIAVKQFASQSVDTLYGEHFSNPPDTDFSRAKALHKRGDVEGAVRLCRGHYSDAPDSPRALFEAERMLSTAGQHEKALEVLHEIAKSFDKDDAAWSRATMRMANIHENELGDRDTADRLLHQIIKRVPQSEIGHLAHGRLNRTWDTDDGSLGLDR